MDRNWTRSKAITVPCTRDEEAARSVLEVLSQPLDSFATHLFFFFPTPSGYVCVRERDGVCPKVNVEGVRADLLGIVPANAVFRGRH